MKKLIRGEKKILEAIKLIDGLLDAIKKETTDEDIKYEIGKAWSITKQYINVYENN